MEERIARTIRNLGSWKDLAQFETNARDRNQLTDEISDALRIRSLELGRVFISEKTDLDLTNLSPAEGKIVEVVIEYVALMRRQGKSPSRTLEQLRNRGLIKAAENAVCRTKPSQGFQTLTEAGLEDLSYEQIVVDHVDEFSQRAVWYSRRTLGLANQSDTPPADAAGDTQSRTAAVMQWLRDRAAANGGIIQTFGNADLANVLGMDDMHRFGRVLGNIQSRIDFACYACDLPPLGLVADKPFDLAWRQLDSGWTFPVDPMHAAARSHVWTDGDFERLLRETERLPGQAHVSWKEEESIREAQIKAWASGLEEIASKRAAVTFVSERLKPGRIYTRDELKNLLSTQDATINTGVFRPAGFSSVLLFVTKDKPNDRTQYVDHLDGDILHWQGQIQGRTDALIIEHTQRGLELLVFYRDRKYEHTGAAFRYEGRFSYVSHSGQMPADFVLLRDPFELSDAVEEAQGAGLFDPLSIEDARKKMLTTIVTRQGQPAFRRALIRAYGGRCAVTGCRIVQVLEAAHILPYRGPETNHISNGLLLRTDLHTLFDLRLVTVDPKTKTLIVAPVLRETEYGCWHNQPLSLPESAANRPSEEALRLHRAQSGL